MDDPVFILNSIDRPYGQPMEQLKRVTSAVIILPPLLCFLYFAPHEFFFILILVLVTLSLHEYFQMLALSQFPVCSKISYMLAFLLVSSAYFGGVPWLPMTVSFAMVALTINTLLTAQPSSQRFLVLLHSLFGIFFIGWTLSHLVLIRSLPAGKWYIFFLCAIVWVADSVAMYVGKSIGRHKMAISISPGKTWEGAAGGVIGGAATAIASGYFLVPQLTIWQRILLGVLLSIAAQISDLGESMLKRYTGVKDSGELIPGHGGLLDRIDSVLFAAPTLLYTLHFLQHGPAI